MKQILLMIAVVALVGCGKEESVQPSASNTETTKPEKERGRDNAKANKAISVVFITAILHLPPYLFKDIHAKED